MEQWYSDAYIPRRQIHVVRRKDVRFTLKGRKSNNRALIISCSDVNDGRERKWVVKKCVSTTDGHVWISHSMAYVLVLQRKLSVIERRDA